MTFNWVDISMMVGIVVILGFDVWLRNNKGPENTFSARIYAWSIKYPIVPLAAGILMGHLFWPNP